MGDSKATEFDLESLRASRRNFMLRAGLIAGGATAAAIGIGTSSASGEGTQSDNPSKPAVFGAASLIVDASPVFRLWDTREDGYGALGTRGIRNVITPYTPADGLSGVIVNVTITDTLGSGYLTVYAKGPRPETSTINWSASGQTIANSTTIFLQGGPSSYNIDVYCGGGGRTQFIIDEVAYLKLSPYAPGPTGPSGSF